MKGYRYRKLLRKQIKYKLAQYLPGTLGIKYKSKYAGNSLEFEFERAVRRSKSLTCIDLGANVGMYTRIMAMEAKRVIAFEPDPWSSNELQKNVDDFDNVKIEKLAVGTENKSVWLYRHSNFENHPIYHSQSSSIFVSHTNVTVDKAIEVKQINFVQYLEDLNEEVGVLKIDIEGAEIDILEALFDKPEIMNRINHIFAETHERIFPEHVPRVERLREKSLSMKQPYINLNWH